MIETDLPHPIPNETPEYRAARNQLLHLEADLRARIADVAAARAALPAGGIVDTDYLFTALQDGKAVEKTLSSLFAGHRSLMIYSFMYGPADDSPCPMCVSFLDGLNGSAPHIRQRTGLAVVTSGPIERTMELADKRNWNHLNLLSCAGTSYNRDYWGESADGDQLPILTVFRKDGEEIRHHWSSELFFAKLSGHPRHVDLLWPVWNAFDLLPQGRGTDWFPALDYGDTQ